VGAGLASITGRIGWFGVGAFGVDLARFRVRGDIASMVSGRTFGRWVK
jgi:hypothetical protein